MMELPVIIIPYCVNGIQDFIQNLEFECVILIDEAEKTFKTDQNSNVPSDEILLKIIDGVYNQSRKLYILTTNKLNINENLIGRPGRIRYIRNFGNLTPKAISEIIDDNLNDKSKKDLIVSAVDLLEISTIDILRSMIDEVNIHGNLGGEQGSLNIPKANYVFRAMVFDDLSEEKLEEVKNLFKPHLVAGDVDKWLNSKQEGSNDTIKEWIYTLYDGWEHNLTSKYSHFYRGAETNYGEVSDEPDEDGWMTITGYSSYSGATKKNVLVLNKKNSPSLYGGKLF